MTTLASISFSQAHDKVYVGNFQSTQASSLAAAGEKDFFVFHPRSHGALTHPERLDVVTEAINNTPDMIARDNTVGHQRRA